MKGYKDFINESSDWNDAKELHKKLMIYIVNRINEETKNINASQIELELDNAFDYDHKEGDSDGYLYCTFVSERLSCGPYEDSIDDHVATVSEALDGLKKLESIIEEIEEEYRVVIFNIIKHADTTDKIGISTNVELRYLQNNKKLENFLNSTLTINKFKL